MVVHNDSTDAFYIDTGIDALLHNFFAGVVSVGDRGRGRPVGKFFPEPGGNTRLERQREEGARGAGPLHGVTPTSAFPEATVVILNSPLCTELKTGSTARLDC